MNRWAFTLPQTRYMKWVGFASDVLKVCGKVPLCKVRCNCKAAAGRVYRIKTRNAGLVPVLIVQCWKAPLAAVMGSFQ